MHLSTRVAPFVLIFAAAAVVAVFARPDEADEPVTTFVRVPDGGFDANLAEVKERSAAKHALVDDLIAGRRGLAEVAALFAALDAGRPGHLLIAGHMAGATAGERYCRVVIGHVDAALGRDRRRRAVLARLDAELAGVVAAGGRLPAVAGPRVR